MRVWLLNVGEPLAIDGPVRLLRYGTLAGMLAARGHLVTEWAPTFIHSSKKHRTFHDRTIQVDLNHRIELFYAGGYTRNVSLGRLLFHRRVAQRFVARAQHETPPSILVVGMPIPELALQGVRYGSFHRLPVVVDVRDLWPDIYLTLLPERLHRLAQWMLWPGRRTNRRIFRLATAIFGVSDSYLKWGLAFARRGRTQADGVFPLAYTSDQPGPTRVAEERRKLQSCGVDPTKVLCCFFGEFEKTYDLETVLEAAHMLEQGGRNDLQFVLCGDGSKRPALVTRAKHITSVVFPGWVSADAVRVLMGMSSVGLAAYVRGALQSLPNKPIEYFAGGLPVVSSLSGELEAILTQNRCGLTYDAGNARALVQAIEFLADHPESRRQMADNSRRLFETHYSADHVYLSLIERLEVIHAEYGARAA